MQSKFLPFARRGDPWNVSGIWASIFILCLLSGILFTVLPITLNAQTSGLGTISGVVTDSSGAMIPGARVTITNMATGVPHESATNDTGYYEVNALSPGKYKILVAISGFQDLLREGITLEA